MIKCKQTIFCLTVLVMMVMFSCSKAKAQESFLGGEGSNLTIKTGVLVTQKEDLEIKLHAGFAEVKQNYMFKNEKNSTQKVVFGFGYKLNAKDAGLDNINISIDNINSTSISSKEFDGNSFTYWKQFETEFAPDQARNVQITYWQQNGASLRGLRTFSYNLKNRLSSPIGEFNIRMYLMDSLNLTQFDKNSNPDLDIKLEPLGWTNLGSTLAWQWLNFNPGFNITANFYWPNSDLAKISELNKNIGLYNIKTTINPKTAFNMVDSSYLTDWEAENFNLANPPKIDISFNNPSSIEELRIIPGKANSLEDFQNYARPKQLKLTFDNGETKTIELSDNLKMQTIKLPEPITAKAVGIAIKSTYPGKINPTTVAISEIEFGSTPEEVTINNPTQAKNNTIWQKIFIQPTRKITNFFKNIF